MHRHDKKWVTEQLLKLPQNKKQVAWDGYKRVYKEAFEAELIDHRKENQARRAANTRLRSYIACSLMNATSNK